MNEVTNNYVRVWNERSQTIGGRGRDIVIQALKTKGFDARPCEAEKGFTNHEGIEVPFKDVFTADAFVVKQFGRVG